MISPSDIVQSATIDDSELMISEQTKSRQARQVVDHDTITVGQSISPFHQQAREDEACGKQQCIVWVDE